MKKGIVIGITVILYAGLVFANDVDTHKKHNDASLAQNEEHIHKMGEMDDHMKHNLTAAKDENLGVCPVMGGKAAQKYAYEYEGKTYNFCCPGCIDAFKENPEKYMNKIKEFKLEAYQFGFEPERIVVSKGDIVRLLATSRDVNHGVSIKEYDINVPVKKGEVTKIEFIAEKAGEFEILCSVYCGKGHRKMKAYFIVEESSEKSEKQNRESNRMDNKNMIKKMK
ncbi:MAG: YHS domain-containing protein [bacterium]